MAHPRRHCATNSIEETLDAARVKIIEKNKERAEFLASELNNTIVINGDALDEEVLAEANLQEAETVLALTNDDEDNLMVSVLVEKFAKDEKDVEDKRTMALRPLNLLMIVYIQLFLIVALKI